MFSLNDSMRYWLYNKPVNMRLGFNGLTGIVNNSMSIRSGDVFVFVNASKNRIKILHKEEGGLVLYAMRLVGNVLYRMLTRGQPIYFCVTLFCILYTLKTT